MILSQEKKFLEYSKNRSISFGRKPFCRLTNGRPSVRADCSAYRPLDRRLNDMVKHCVNENVCRPSVFRPRDVEPTNLVPKTLYQS